MTFMATLISHSPADHFVENLLNQLTDPYTVHAVNLVRKSATFVELRVCFWRYIKVHVAFS